MDGRVRSQETTIGSKNCKNVNWRVNFLTMIPVDKVV